MSEKNTEKAPKVKKPKTKTSQKFVGPNGELQVVLNRVAPGSIQTYVVFTKTDPSQLSSKGKPKKIRQRGVTESHKDEVSAKTAVDKIVAQATKMGWVAKTKQRKAKTDVFDLAHLPTAKK